MNDLDKLRLMIYESDLDENEKELCLEAVEECETYDEFCETANDVLCLMETRTIDDRTYADIGEHINTNRIKENRKKNPLYGTQYERMSDVEKRRRDLKEGSRDMESDYDAPDKIIARKYPGNNRSFAHLRNGNLVTSRNVKTEKDRAQIKKYEQQKKKLPEYRENLVDSMEALHGAKNNKEINKIIRSRREAGKKTYDVRDPGTYLEKLFASRAKDLELDRKISVDQNTKENARINLIRRVQSGEATPKTKKYIHDTFGGKYDYQD